MPGDRFLELVSASDRRVLDALFRHAREGVTIQGPDSLVYANDQAALLVGLETGAEMMATPVRELIDRFEMLDEDEKPFPVERLPGRLVLEGQETPEVTIGYRLEGSRHVRWSRVNASPIKNDRGETVWALNFFLDITDQVALRERERTVVRVSDALSTSLHMRPNLVALNDIIVPEIASWCGFHILDEYDNLIPDAVAFPTSEDAETLFALADTGPIPRDSDQMQARVLATGKKEYIPKITEELLRTAEEQRGKEFADVLRRLDLRSILCVPIDPSREPVGTMTLVRTRADGGFSAAELGLIDEIALRAGVALTNARAYEKEHHSAEALRRGLRPETLPSVAGLEMAVKYLPVAWQGHVGGDFYDFIKLDSDRGLVLVGDVEGKGVEAAAAVGLIRQTLKTTISLDPDPAVVFRQLNEALTVHGSPSRMCTLAYVTLARSDVGFSGTVALAGHPPPLVWRRDGSSELVGEVVPPAGLFDDLDPVLQQFELSPGDLMIAYTDGLALPDLTSPETVARLVDQIDTSDPGELVDEMIRRFGEEVPAPRDDIALMAVRVTD